MTGLFDSGYAAAYDLMYQDKNYSGECDAIERLLGELGETDGKRVLDLGCGTGGHSLELSTRGYEVVGLDQSTSMLDIASAKAKEQGTNVHFIAGDLRSFELDGTFDVILCMFAVLNYQVEDDDVLAALQNARRHLAPGGLLIGDIWYGPAVITLRPQTRFSSISDGMRRLLKFSTGTLDTARQTCLVDLDLWMINGKVVEFEAHETHEIRYFFPRELSLLFEASGMDLVRIGSFPNHDQPPTDQTWNVFVAGRATSRINTHL